MTLTFSNLPDRVRTAALVVTLVIGPVLWGVSHVVEARAELDAQQRALDALRDQMSHHHAATDRQRELEDHVRSLERRLDELGGPLSAQGDLGELLTQLDVLAIEAGVTIRSFKPLAIEQKAEYRQSPLALQVDASYQALMRFLHDISALPRLVTVDKLSIVGHNKSNPNGPTIHVTCVLSTFALNPLPSPHAQVVK